MPKLKAGDVERNRREIEKAALRVFIQQGYHGTSVRDIATACDVSVGNIYNYYKTKEELFVALIERYEARMETLRGEAFQSLGDVFEPQGLTRLAEAIRNIVYGNPDYWRLMYIDVVEFGNRHFAHTFKNLAKNMEAALGERLRQATSRGQWNGIDPCLAFTAIYLQFFTYFLVEKLFGGKQHLGVPDEQAVQQLVAMMTHGVWKALPAAGEKRHAAKNTG